MDSPSKNRKFEEGSKQIQGRGGEELAAEVADLSPEEFRKFLASEKARVKSNWRSRQS
jgi:hypothetical protein